MGCDIHFMVEVKKNGKWESADEWEIDESWWDFESIYNDRNYDLFAILANVRNGYGFAGVKTGDGFVPISTPRGLPDDVSFEVKRYSNQWGADGHSHSWLTLEELKKFDWSQKTKHNGFVNQKEFAVFIKNGKPNSWCGGVFSPNIVSNEIMSCIVNSGNDIKTEYYTEVEWGETYAESVDFFLNTIIPQLEGMGNPENVRIVFFFDN